MKKLAEEAGLGPVYRLDISKGQRDGFRRGRLQNDDLIQNLLDRTNDQLFAVDDLDSDGLVGFLTHDQRLY